MTHAEKKIGYAVAGCLNDWGGKITRELCRDLTSVFCSRTKVNAKNVLKFVESKVVHTI